MRRKILFTLLSVVTAIFVCDAWGQQILRLARLGPTSPALTGIGSSEQQVTLASAGTGVRNCLSHLAVTSSANFTLRVLDGGTTVYAVDVSTLVTTGGGGGGIYDNEFQNDEMCGSAATAMYVKISTSASPVLTSTQKLNYSGFTY